MLLLLPRDALRSAVFVVIRVSDRRSIGWSDRLDLSVTRRYCVYTANDL